MTYSPGAYLPRYDHQFYPSDLVCLAALDLYRQVSGGSGLYGTAGAEGPFSSATAQTLSSMISEMTAFWTTAQADFDSGTSFKGFSSAAPCEYFDSWPADKGSDRLGPGLGSWQPSTAFDDRSVTGRNYATGLWALAEVHGATQSTVVDVWTWLMTFTSNPDYERQEDEADTVMSGDFDVNQFTTHGVYDPTVALSDGLLVKQAGVTVAMNSTGSYDVATMGLLARIQDANNSGALAAAKKKFANARQRGDPFGGAPQVFDDLRLATDCGLNFQTFDGLIETVQAAMAGLAYRFGNSFPTPVRP